MSKKGSVFQKGGGGTNFEQAVQAAFLTTLIVRGNVPCVASSELIEVAFQVTNRRYQTDDLLAIAKSSIGTHRLLIQIKHNISFTEGDKNFKEVIKAFWKDYSNPSIFDKTKDKLIVIKSGLTQDERNHLKALFNWANSHATETDFTSEIAEIKAKRARLETFRTVLKEANDEVALTDRELWEFLRCMDVLEYDFSQDGSVDEAYFLNLIKLSKRKSSVVTEKEIWDSIVAYVGELNPQGGSVTLESIKNQDFFHHFDNVQLSPHFDAIEKLKSDSIEILRPIKTFIGKNENSFQLPRTEVKEKILEALSCNRITIVTGKPGVGKSAEIKEILHKNFSSAGVFVFRADQFNEPTLSKVFSSQGVNETIRDVFSCISLIPEKIIFIDSLEKLLEADPDCAFKQLIELLKEHPEIRVIFSSRKYAIDLILLKFGIDKKDTNIIEIPAFQEKELGLVSEKFPQLNSVLANDKVKKLLGSPKYLDFAILAISKTSEDYTNTSLVEFKNKLWNSLVADSTNTKNGLPIKREKAFMEIAVKRAKAMKLFVKPDESDAEAIVYLEKDGIVFQEGDNRKYSPTHDILEDWALVKYVSEKFEDFPKPKELFSNLGNEPAIRRAFRLWIEDFLIENSSKINEFIEEAISDPTLEQYWADELLVAVFKSENSSSFFSGFQNKLLADNANFLHKCLRIITTCCKEGGSDAGNYNILLPIGSGWKEALFFINKNISQLEVIRFSILNFLSEWHNRLFYQYREIENLEFDAAKSIVLTYLQEIEEQNEFWYEEEFRTKASDLISILFDLSIVSKEEIKQLVARAFANKSNRDFWRLRNFYEKVIDKCLSGMGNWYLIKEIPELIVETAWKNWKYNPPKKEDISNDRFGGFAKHSLFDSECWGIRENQSFFPSGIYKTPVYNLLRAHPIIGLKFIVDFINYSVEFYVNSTCECKHKISQIEIELNDGAVIKLWAAWELWAAYRGSSVTHYALESLLMSFEKFLLETAKRKSDISKENIRFLFDYVLKNSNNIAPLAVLTSVAIAYPNEVGDAMLPLLSVREFYEWDINRIVQESVALAPLDFNIPFAQKERWESNQLPHRSKYRRGLMDFVIDYQFNIRTFNKELCQIFDKLKAKCPAEDVDWQKILTEIDIRNYKLGEYDEKHGGYPIEPKYEEKVVEHLAATQDYFDKQNIKATYSNLISESYKKEGEITFEKWAELCEYYSSSIKLDYLYDKPITLAVIGLKGFVSELTKVQKDWCIETLSKSIIAILQDAFTGRINSSDEFNLIEKEVALSSFHILMQNAESEEDKDELIGTLIYVLISSFGRHENEKIIQYFRETFFKHYPNEAKRVWLGLIKYSNFKKENPNNHGHQGYDKDLFEKEGRFIQEISSDKGLILELAEIGLEKSASHILAKALAITPCDSDDKDFTAFISHMLPIVLDDLTKEEVYSYSEEEETQRFYPESISYIQQYFANLLLDADFSFSKSILTVLINFLLDNPSKQRYGRDNLWEFVRTILDLFVAKLYDNGNLQIDQAKYSQQQANFWNLWEVLFDLTPSDGSHIIIKKLMLDIEFLIKDSYDKPKENNWDVLNGKKDFYKRVLMERGTSNTLSAINVFSTIGEKEFLPEGISWLTEIFKSNPNSTSSLATVSAERMIKWLFYNHIHKIKKDKTLTEDYIWVLNRMVDLGSSQAYLFRESVITYKTTD